MKHKWMILLVFLALPWLSLEAQEYDEDETSINPLELSDAETKFNKEVNWDEVGEIVLQENGRLVPLDTYARNLLLKASRKSSYKQKDADTKETYKMSATQWFAELIFNPQNSTSRKYFKVLNDEVPKNLDVTPDKRTRMYSMVQLSQDVGKMETQRLDLEKIERKHWSEAEVVFMNLYSTMVAVGRHTRAMECFVPLFKIDNVQFQKDAGFEKSLCSYYELFKQRDKLNPIFDKVVARITDLQKTNKDNKKEDDSVFETMSDYDKKVAFLQIQLIGYLKQSPHAQSESERFNAYILLPIVPSEISGDEEKLKTVSWGHPWQGLHWGNSQVADIHFPLLDELNKMALAYSTKNAKDFNQHVMAYKKLVGYQEFIAMEQSFNQTDYQFKSLIFYLLAAIFLFFGFPFKTMWPRRIGLVLLWIGLYYNIEGIVKRCVVSSRPPVTTLYESIIFVAGAAVLACVLMEFKHRQYVLALGAALVGTILQFIGIKYVAAGDGAITVMRAVLDSNFWLSTHVVSITLGYALSFVVGILAHIYLALIVFKMKDKIFHKNFYKIIIWFSLVALFLSTLGTILGGIWADQSWGRFWGWDPKENGAMLIVLWLLFLTHGRLSGILREVGFCTGLIILNIVVSLAWFGVNLLSVGLHSYGFTEGIAVTLGIFIAIELILALVLGLTAKNQLEKNSQN